MISDAGTDLQPHNSVLLVLKELNVLLFVFRTLKLNFTSLRLKEVEDLHVLEIA